MNYMEAFSVCLVIITVIARMELGLLKRRRIEMQIIGLMILNALLTKKIRFGKFSQNLLVKQACLPSLVKLSSVLSKKSVMARTNYQKKKLAH